MRSQNSRSVISSLLLMTASIAMAQSSTSAAGSALKGKEIYDVFHEIHAFGGEWFSGDGALLDRQWSDRHRRRQRWFRLYGRR